MFEEMENYYNYGAGEFSDNPYDHQVILFEIQNLREEINEEKNQRASEINDLKRKITLLEKDNQKLKDALDIQEAKSRKNNIIIFGADENDSTETANSTEKVIEICKSLNVDIENNQISDAFRIGRNKGNRPIICKVASFNKKCEIMRKSKTQSSLKILNDLTKKERRDRKEFHEYVNRARNNGCKAYVRNGALVVNGTVYTKADLYMSGNADVNLESILSGAPPHSPTRCSPTPRENPVLQPDTVRSEPPSKMQPPQARRTTISRHTTLHENAAALTPSKKEKQMAREKPSTSRDQVNKKSPTATPKPADLKKDAVKPSVKIKKRPATTPPRNQSILRPPKTRTQT